ncbi:MAG: RICIN domain-containing protein [Acidobacteriaceae bacterium]|nr:RICIN domain-containing protein [Acidobacteriaceae bacterium]
MSLLKESVIRFSFPCLLLAATSVVYAQTPTLGGCQVFPADNVWNARVDKLPLDKNSAAYVASANATNTKLHPDFGHGNPASGGMPYNLVPDSQPKVTVPFYYLSDPGPYPIPNNVWIEGGSDRHTIMVDTGTCELYEIFNLTGGPGTWKAGSGATWSLKSDALRPNGWTSADAAGLPMLPGLVRYDEVAAGHIDHALRFTIDHTRGAHIWPARHDASALTGTQYPPMGQRFRLKASYDISSFAQPVQVILQALKTYGMILADNGTSWHLQGVGDERWNDDTMHALTEVTGGNFEAVDESSLMVNVNSGATHAQPAQTIPTGWVNVISKNSGKCLDMAGGPAATWQTDQAQQWTCLGAAQTNQQFQFTPVTGGYKIEAKNSGLALQVTGGLSATNGSMLEQWPFDGQSYQIWKVTPTSDGYFSISPTSSANSCMDVEGISKNNGAHVQQWTCWGGDNQKWSLVTAP